MKFIAAKGTVKSGDFDAGEKMLNEIINSKKWLPCNKIELIFIYRRICWSQSYIIKSVIQNLSKRIRFIRIIICKYIISQLHNLSTQYYSSKQIYKLCVKIDEKILNFIYYNELF